MTITFVAAGAASTGNNASLAPAAPAGLAVGDLVIIHASIRNTGTGTVNTPTGWTLIRAQGSSALIGRFHPSGGAMPTVTFAGGVANADTIARAFAFRGVSTDALTASTTSGQANVSAANLAYPALNVPGNGHAVVLSAWKQDDATAYSTPATFTAIGLTSTTTGDDASQADYYVIQTTEADVSSGTITVTGGAAAVSSAQLLALKPAAAIAAAEQDSYPPRVQVSVTGLTIGDDVALYRVVDGERTLVRGATSDAVTDPAYVVVDAEIPFGVPVSYVAVVEGQVEYATAAVTYELPGGTVVLSDAITGQAAEVIIGAAGEQAFNRDSARFRVAGRNVVVSGPPGQAEGTYELLTLTTSQHNTLMTLLATATAGVVQIRQPGYSEVTGDPYDGVDAYLAVDRVVVRRFSQDGSDPRRLTTIDYAETDGWAAALEARGFTLEDISDYLGASSDLDDLDDFFGGTGTLLSIALADWTP